MYSRTYDNRMGVLKGDLGAIPKAIDSTWRIPFPSPTFRWQADLNGLVKDPEYAHQRLWASVLAQAVQEVLGIETDRYRSQVDDYPDAHEWICTRDPDCNLGTFDGVCLALDLDADTIRRDLNLGAPDHAAA